MSRKIKLSSKKGRLKKVKRPTRISFKFYVGDLAGCGHIRLIFPSLLLNTYYNPNDKIQFEAMYDIMYNPDPNSYRNNLCVVFQRASTKQQFMAIQHFKKNNPGKKLFYEIDDNLFDIPEWNFAHQFYVKNIEYIKKIMSMCDGMVVSTRHLKDLYSKYNSNIQISPNHLPKFLWGEMKQHPTERKGKVRICYPGSFNHFDSKSDKGDFDGELIEFVEKTLDKYQWVFVGGCPVSLKGNDKIEYHDWQPVLEYANFIKNLNIDIMLAPLANISFNRSKSNIKALEATAIGVPLICTDIDPYCDLPGRCKSTEEMISMIEKTASDVNFSLSIWKKQHSVLKDQLYWEENKNVLKFVNSYLKLMGRCL